jgi:hypothetical protein
MNTAKKSNGRNVDYHCPSVRLLTLLANHSPRRSVVDLKVLEMIVSLLKMNAARNR